MLVDSAKEYARLLDSFYVFQSNDFRERKFYIISFNEENFLHLTGVRTKMHAAEFYRKCLDGGIKDDEYDCCSSKELKGKVKEKMKYLPRVTEIILKCEELEERFSKGRVTCILAVAQGEFTMGFDGGNVLFPRTLMHKNRVDPSKRIIRFEKYKIEKHGNENKKSS